jgi:hypothetical protein
MEDFFPDKNAEILQSKYFINSEKLLKPMMEMETESVNQFKLLNGLLIAIGP